MKMKVGTLVKKQNPFGVPYLDNVHGIVVDVMPYTQLDKPDPIKVNWFNYGVFWCTQDSVEVISESR